MYTENDRDVLDLPEINRNKIADNYWDIMLNRWIMIAMCVLTFGFIAGTTYYSKQERAKNMRQCETMLYEHLYGQPDPLKGRDDY